MKRAIFSLIFLANLSFSKGIVICLDCAEFEKLPKEKQDEIIKKDFKKLHKLVEELDEIINSIKSIQKEIDKMKLDLKNSDGTCDALDLIKLDLDAFEKELSKIGNKNSSQYKELYMEYHKQKKVYNKEKIKYSCKKQEV